MDGVIISVIHHQSRRVPRRCSQCGQPFSVPASRAQQRYCGWDCYVASPTKAEAIQNRPDSHACKRDEVSAEQMALLATSSSMTAAEAAHALGIHLVTWRRWRRRFGLPDRYPKKMSNEQGEHRCNCCKLYKPPEAFTKRSTAPTGLNWQCRDCTRARANEANRRMRLEVLTTYCEGEPACRCCGESRYEFLVLDHIHGDGNAHRRELSASKTRGGTSSHNLCRWARRHGCPPILQVLCHNCNNAKSAYGQCPHERERANSL